MARDSRHSGGRQRSGRARGAPAQGEAPPQGGVLRRANAALMPYVLAVGFALLLRALVIDTFYVPSGSMLPTLLIGDHIFVNKFAYGARIPILGWRFPAVRDPIRGEVVVFQLGRRGRTICPLDRCPDYGAENFVKRIVGLPGDRISVRDGVVTLNGQVLSLVGAGEQFETDKGERLDVKRENLGEHDHAVLDHPQVRGLQQTTIRVPDDHYFFLGDNRDGSNDSRGWGTVAREHLFGPVILIYWSWNNQNSWLEMLNPMTWVRLLRSEMRWERTGQTLV